MSLLAQLVLYMQEVERLILNSTLGTEQTRTLVELHNNLATQFRKLNIANTTDFPPTELLIQQIDTLTIGAFSTPVLYKDYRNMSLVFQIHGLASSETVTVDIQCQMAEDGVWSTVGESLTTSDSVNTIVFNDFAAHALRLRYLESSIGMNTVAIIDDLTWRLYL